MDRVRKALVIWTMVVAACGPPAEGTTTLKAPTSAEMKVFCSTYETVRGSSRQEIMFALDPVAPAQVRGAIKRASELGSTFEDDHSISEFLKRCARTSAD